MRACKYCIYCSPLTHREDAACECRVNPPKTDGAAASIVGVDQQWGLFPVVGEDWWCGAFSECFPPERVRKPDPETADTRQELLSSEPVGIAQNGQEIDQPSPSESSAQRMGFTDRKISDNPELNALVEEARKHPATEEELAIQRENYAKNFIAD